MAENLPGISWDTLYTSRGNDDFLGRGAFSQVYRCYHHAHGDVAVKILSKCGSKDIGAFTREGRTHLRANNFPHIVRLLGVTQHTGLVGLVLEYMPYGSLYDLLNDHSLDLPWTFRLRALQETAAAIAFLHNLSEDKVLVHCDLKAENILLSSDLHVKIADFGGANLANYTGASIEPSVSTCQPSRAGLLQYTLSHAAPEILGRQDAKRTTQMDVYSFAIVMYVVTCRIQPFGNLDPSLLEHEVKCGRRPTAMIDEVGVALQGKGDVTAENIFNLFIHLMQQCWRQDPKQRLRMTNVRDSLKSKLDHLPEDRVNKDVFTLKSSLTRRKSGKPVDAINVLEKYKQITSGVESVPTTHRTSLPLPVQVQSESLPSSVVLPSSSPSRGVPVSPQASASPLGQHQRIEGRSNQTVPQTPPQPPTRIPVVGQDSRRITSEVSAILPELENSFADPYLRDSNMVRMISDIAAIKNAQVGHGGWDDSLLALVDVVGTVSRIEMSGDVTVSFSGICSHRFNPSSLVKIPSENDLHVGDFVIIELEKDLVQVLQEDHGGWVDEMHQYFSQPGLIFRFLPDKDVLVVHKNGMYFRFNPEVLCKCPSPLQEDICLPGNPDIKIGDYVCHDLDEEVIKELQEASGGWNEAMATQQGKVGKFVFADYNGRAFVAYNSKMCFVFNPVALNKLSKEEAIQRFTNSKEESNRVAKVKASLDMQHHTFAVGDVVRVLLPLDLVIELQRGHGGWCYQMLEVYGVTGAVKEFDENGNAAVLFDTGTKWTFNPAALEKIPAGGPVTPPTYAPPFRIGDKVRVKLKDLSNASLNKMRQAFRILEIPEEKVDILMKSGVVLGIDDDIDVIVSFGDGKNYGLKPEQLQKI